MPIVSESGLILIKAGAGFDVYDPSAKVRLGYVEPFWEASRTGPGWRAYDADDRQEVDRRYRTRHYRTRKAAAEALYK